MISQDILLMYLFAPLTGLFIFMVIKLFSRKRW